MTAAETPIRFSADGYSLAGVFHHAGKEGAPVVIGVHGLLADKESPKQLALAEALNRLGISFFRFDHRGCGQSEGLLARDTTLENRCRDLAAALDAVAQHTAGEQSRGLFGSSFGGCVCLAFSERFWKGPVATWAAPVRSRPLTAAMRAVTADGRYPDFDDLVFDISARLGGKAPALVAHGGCDELVPVDTAREIYACRQGPRELLIIDDCDHRISSPPHQQAFTNACTLWLARWLGRV